MQSPRFARADPPGTSVGSNKTFTSSPLDRLNPLETVDEDWPEGTPTRAGWHSRVRIVKTSFKSELLRIEESIEFKQGGNGLEVVGTIIRAATDARHVLVSSDHLQSLTRLGLDFERGRNPNFVKVPIGNPNSVSSIPSIIGGLKDAGLQIVEPDSVISTCAHPSDPVLANGLAWHLDNLGLLPGHRTSSDIHAPAAWDIRTDASSVLVAVIDSGIASNDPELIPSLHSFPGENLGDGLDNDGNGYIDDVFGYDFYQNDSRPDDEGGHGSMCAALIGAVGSNGFGSTGVAWKASILNCRFLNGDGLGVLSDAIDAIDYARAAGARILNLSWSYEGDATLLAEALGRCDAAGIVMVCASGNSGWASPVPAPGSISLPNLVTVAATTASDTLAPFSVVDPKRVDLAAPGVDLPVELHSHPWDSGADVTYVTGTSFSAAIVSGSLALALAEFPAVPSGQMIRRMLETVDPIQGGAIALASGGRINLVRLLSGDETAVPHDQFSERLVLTDASGQWTGRNNGAGVEEVDANLGVSPAPLRSIWFEWTAPCSGVLRIHARSEADQAVRLAVFSKSDGHPGGLIARSINDQAVEIPVVAGQELLWMLDSSVDIGQGLALTWQLPPSNDNWLAATTATGVPVTITGNSLGATVESFELSKPHNAWLPQGSVWWRWIPDQTGSVSITTTEGHFTFLLPLDNGAPDFPEDYEYTNVLLRRQYVQVGRTYAILVVPQTPAAAGPFSVSLLGLEDIAILVHPADTATLAGESVELEVQYASDHYPAFQWYKNGEPIPFASGPKLKLSPVSDRSFGSYHVAVSSNTTTLQSQPAVVSPRYEKPRLISQTPPRSVVTGQTVDLGAVFRSASEMTYFWRKNGQVVGGATSASFLIYNCTLASAGGYSLTATNAAGSSTASFQVNVFETPWKGWVDRTPASAGRGPIQNVTLEGNAANAFTSTEWLRSTDGGQNWSSSPLPVNFVAEYGAADSNGVALITGGAFSTYGAYLQDGMWKYTTTSGWQPIQPVLIPPSGSPINLARMGQPTFFDGKWWARTHYDYPDRIATSTDGVTWTLLTDPYDSSKEMRATNIFRYEDCLAISFSTPSSLQNTQLRFIGGGVKTLTFSDAQVTNIARIGNACYHPHFASTEKILDSQTSPTTIPINGLFSASSMFEGIREGDFLKGLEISTNTTGIGTGQLRAGVFEKTPIVKSIGFSCYSKSGNRWLVGYPDGRLWSGTDLSELPVWRQDFDPTPNLTAYESEFTFGKYHSSDGSRWQNLGAANKEQTVVRPLGYAGSKFLHSILENGYGLPSRKFMSESIYPSAHGPSNDSEFQSYVWSGEDSLLRTDNSTAVKVFQIIKDQPPGLLIGNSNPGVSWRWVDSAKQINGRWFVSGGVDSPIYQRFLITSANGNTWQASPLPAACVVGKKGSTLIAIENSTRGYSSTTGTSWTPFTPQGLPVLNQINQPATPSEIASYRGYFVARYGKFIYASADGISWALGSAPLPISYLKENRHTLLAVTESGQVLQPSGEIDTGPLVTLPESQQAVTISRNQGIKYELSADDADGDLASVSCLLNGVSIASLNASPFVFSVNSGVPGVHAVEFVARDQAGRISRVTSSLTILEGGVVQAMSLPIDSDLSKAVLFKGSYYRIHSTPMNTQKVICVWEGGNLWRPVSPQHHKPWNLVANAEALVASTLTGILTSLDGLKWTHLDGFDPLYSQGPIVFVDHGQLKVQGAKIKSFWTSMDGVSWTVADNPTPWASTTTLQKVVWADQDFGLTESNHVTTDGARTWTPIPGAPAFGTTISVKNGFLTRNENGIYRILKGEYSFTPIELETSWPRKFYIAKVDGLAFVGKTGVFLKTTEDGVQFTHHNPPPNKTRVSLMRFGGEWIATSGDMICASKDLKSWRILLDFHDFGYSTEQLGEYTLNIARDGLDGMLFEHPRLPTLRFAMNETLEIKQISATVHGEVAIPNGRLGGLRFKNRTIAMDDWYYTRPDNSATWEKSPLSPAVDLGPQPFFPSTWPTRYFSEFSPSGLFAASDHRFVTLTPYLYNTTRSYVVTSDDGRNFTVHDWNAPVPLKDVRHFAASSDLFLAAATSGRVLRSANGLEWTLHQVSPAINIASLLFFNGKWHVAGMQGTQAEVWSSTDGISWSLTSSLPASQDSTWEKFRPSFIAQGTARMYIGASGWLRSADGTNWQLDQPLNQSINTNNFEPKGGHSQGIIGAGSNGQIVIVNESTGGLVRWINTGSAAVAWLEGVPFLSSLGFFSEWTEVDPRFTEISATSGTFGVGDNLEIQLAVAELEDSSTRLHLFLTTDLMVGNDDDVMLAMPTWNDGQSLPGGMRRFTVALPPSLHPGRFKVGAKMLPTGGGNDASVENNQTITEQHMVDVPGYELRLSTVGQGVVNTGDPRVIYPKGARLQLQAVPQNGFTFRAWSGSFVSQESSISVLMNEDKQLSVSFDQGNRVIIRKSGHGTIAGAPTDGVLLPGESVNLSQVPGPGWKGGGWVVDGIPRQGATLSLEPESDVLIEGLFIPDFTAWRTKAFSGAAPGIDRSWDADPDGDGLNNWQEVLLSSNPVVAGGINQMLEKSTDQLRLIFTRPQGRHDAPWIMPESSEDLLEWKMADSLRMTERILSQQDGMETVEVTLPIRNGTRRFLHLRMAPRPSGL